MPVLCKKVATVDGSWLVCLIIQLSNGEYWYDFDCIVELLKVERQNISNFYYTKLSENLNVLDEIRKDPNWINRWGLESKFFSERQLLHLVVDSKSINAITAIEFCFSLRHDIISKLIIDRDTWKNKAEFSLELLNIIQN